MSNYRNRKLLDLSHRVPECQFRLPGCKGWCEACEPAHADGLRYGKGTGIKSHDYYHVASCHACHEAYAKLPKAEKEAAFMDGWERTLALYFRKGWIGVLK